MNTTIRNTGYVTESLSKGELSKLKQMVLGYGKFQQTATFIGIPETTLRTVIQRGYGKPETITKIRAALRLG
jgi:hypothetical protein